MADQADLKKRIKTLTKDIETANKRKAKIDVLIARMTERKAKLEAQLNPAVAT